MTTRNNFHDFEPYDCTPGEAWESFDERFMNWAAGIVDDRGSSVADYILDIDEGGAGAGALAMPHQPAEARKAMAARQKRNKKAYGLLTQHITDPDHISHIRLNFFQEGRLTYNYLQAECQLAITATRLRELNRKWDDIDMLADVGVDENTILNLSKKLKVLNSKRPVASRKTVDQLAERLLELIFDNSKHFLESASIEYNATIGNRSFEHVAPHPLAGMRNFPALSQHYHLLWKQAVESKTPGFAKRAPQARPAVSNRNTLEAGMLTQEGHTIECMLQAEAGSENYFVPRPGSPSQSLSLLANAGNDIASRRGTSTTTDWTLLSQEELNACVDANASCVECDSGGELALVFDNDDSASVELICDCCRGLGHVKRVCPSNRRRFRSLQYAIGVLSAKHNSLGNTAPRKPPPRGQRAPFRAQPRRFQPKFGGRGSGNRGDGRFGRPQSLHSAESAIFSAGEGDDDATLSGGSFPSESSTDSESVRSAVERAASAVEPLIPMMRTSFALSDDELFAAEAESATPVETIRFCTESLSIPDPPTARKRYLTKTVLGVGGLLTSVTALFVGATVGIVSTTLGFGMKLTAGAVTIMMILTSCVGIGAANYLDTHEAAFITPEAILSLSPSSGLVATIDSGATSTAIPVKWESFLKTVTDANPNQQIKIADDRYLEIIKIGEAEFPVQGFPVCNVRPEPQPWPSKAISDTLPSSRTLVVEGLGESTLLIAPRILKRDRVYTYLNPDNSLGRSDCLRLPSGTIVPFLPTPSYQIAIGSQPNCANSTAETGLTVMPLHQQRRSAKCASLLHNALGHSGAQRLVKSNIIIDGVQLRNVDFSGCGTCEGCRRGNASLDRSKKRKSLSASVKSTAGFTHFGQQIDSDICTSFEASFPHQFTCMTNFIDRHGKESWLFFLRQPTSSEIASSATSLHEAIKHRLLNGKIGRWLTDNSRSYLSDEVDKLAQDLAERRGYNVPNATNNLPVPERHWGVLERMMRSALHVAPEPIPQCLWPWGAQQANHLLYYLPTASFNPPMSPYQFNSGDTEPVDLSWARTMYCDVTVSIAQRDVHGKLGARSADGCHLGYDVRRNGHFCYIPTLHRLSTFTVTNWRENSFTHAMRIRADTPCEYTECLDLPVGSVTNQMLPRRYTTRGLQAQEKLHVLVVFHRDKPDSIVSILRSHGHTVTTFDVVDGQDLSLRGEQQRLLRLIDSGGVGFVFWCPPCKTASIAYVPPLRSKQHPRGMPDVAGKKRELLHDANVLFDFTVEGIHHCETMQVAWCVENCAQRAGPGPASWTKFENNGFFWDFPTLKAIPGKYIVMAQCAFDADYQKYTGLYVSLSASDAFVRLFSHAICNHKTHARRLQGYDTDGIAFTEKAQKYNPRLSAAFASAIEESCGVRDQEGEQTVWSRELFLMSQARLQTEMAVTAPTPNAAEQDHGIFKGLSRQEIIDLNAAAHRERNRLSPRQSAEFEIWSSNAEGAYRVSEIGEVTVPKTLKEAMTSSLWPLLKTAMEEEITGKLANDAWVVVKRPGAARVHPSRWVFAAKFNNDGSVKSVKARFVGCGYTMIKDDDYDQVFAATLPGVSFRVLLVCIADENLETDHIDAVKAFTQADIDKEVHVEMPEGFATPGYVLLLRKALEGIKQGANLWFKHNRAAWLKLGFVSWTNEPNLYYHERLGIRVGVFADDTLAGFPQCVQNEYVAVKAEYAKLINIGSVSICKVIKFTGVDVHRDRARRTITINQEQYISQLAVDYEGRFNLRETPYGSSKEDRTRFDKLHELDGEPVSKSEFLGLCGKLVWPSSMTRPDISEATSVICSQVSDPKAPHFEAGLVVLGYLVRTKSLGITYGGKLRIPLGLSEYPPGFEESCGLYVAHDSSWGSQVRPMGGYVVMYGNGAVDWSAKLLKIVPDSSCEAETAVGSRAVKSCSFARELLKENGRKVVGPTAAIGDNLAMHTIVQQEGASVRTRYYERATMLIKRAIMLLIFRPYLVKTTEMIADIFTKATDKGTFFKMRNVVMNCTSSLRESLDASASTVHGEARLLVDRLLMRV